MAKWKDKVAVVTGASAGIGAAIAVALAKSGMKVVGLARRIEKIDELSINHELNDKLFSYKADLTIEDDILEAFTWTTNNVGPVSVLINNAGIAQPTTLHSGDTDKWSKVLDTNVLAVAIASREAIRIMTHNVIDGYININSIAGHVILDSPGINIYSASKHAVTAMTETLRFELARLKSNIRVTNLSPGGVRTEIVTANKFMTEVAFEEMMKNRKNPILESEDIADAVLYLLGTPLRVQIDFNTIIKRHCEQEFIVYIDTIGIFPPTLKDGKSKIYYLSH